MPIKFPKGFVRRRSSGNVLDEVESAPTQSFRVLERPNGASISFDGGPKSGGFSAHRLAGPSRQRSALDSFEEDRAASNRGSGGSNTNSASTGDYHDNASSTRLSSASTVPSSVEVQNADGSFSQRNLKQPHNTNPPTPASQPAFSLRAGGRTFSFGNKAPKVPAHELSNPPPVPNLPLANPHGTDYIVRSRAMTESSYASTATPPKLETSLSSTDLGDLSGFSNMFDTIGKRKSALIDATQPSADTSSPSPTLPIGPAKSQAGPSLAPIRTGRSDLVESSPYSWGSPGSTDRLMSSPSPQARPLGQEQSPTAPTHQSTRTSTTTKFGEGSSSQRPARPAAAAVTGLRRSTAFADRRSSSLANDDDAQLVFDSMNAVRALSEEPQSLSPPAARSPVASRQPALFDSDDADFSGVSHGKSRSSETTPRAVKPKPVPSVSLSPLGGYRSAGAQQKKVMTPAEFEKYRRQKELSRSTSFGSNSDESDAGEDNYEDIDEAERNRQLAKQRRKQEAHLSVYRQQMMKVTGEQPSELGRLSQARPSLGDRSSVSAPNLLGTTSSLSLGEDKSTPNTKASDDEDDDIPLAILAAHGFPNRNRPPTRLSVQGSNPNLRSSSQMGSHPPPAASVAGDGGASGRHSTLPPFARHLPQDPYVGASLVNASNRESLSYGHNAGGGMAGGGSTGVPPGGLVGVIAGEERARAMRRGSPNGGMPANGPNMPMPGQHMGMGPMGMPGMPVMPGMPGIPGMPAMSPGDHAQIQMSQQMTEMMQMQMQWMQQMQQQMMQMQGGQMASQLPPQQGAAAFLSPPGLAPRPASVAPNLGPSPQAHRRSTSNQRTMSLLDPGSLTWHPGDVRQSQYAPSFQMQAPGPMQHYSPSIAPSERSNVGQPSRYRPVSTAPPAQGRTSRASTFTTGTMQDWAPKNGATVGLQGAATKGDSDDDDDEGWEELKKKREKKKSSWKLKRDTNGFKDMLFSSN